jgi:hypothetical protein
MMPKERMFKSLMGEKTDAVPAAPSYLSLYLADAFRTHYIEQYRNCMKGRKRYPMEHAEDTYFRMQALIHSYDVFKTPPDWIEVGTGVSKSWAERTEIVTREGILCYEDKLSGVCVPMQAIPVPYGDEPLDETIPSGRDIWDISGQISSRGDVEAQMPIMSTEDWLERGDFDLPLKVVAEYGDRYFISTILDTPYSDMYDYLGFRGLMVFQRRKPELLQLLLQRRLMQSKEVMAAWAATGIHGVYVEEVFSGADIISPQSYVTFIFSYNQPYFEHMGALGLSAIHYVCGDVLPRLEYMVEYDIAAVAVEESKKGFRIELAEVVERVAGRKTVIGNIDAVRFGIHATPEEMSAEVRRQAGIGAQARGFIASTGSPFPLETDPRMIDTLVATAHSIPNQTDIKERSLGTE